MHSESQWRYRAKRLGFRLVRYGRSLGHDQYGPYGLVDRATGRLVAARLGPSEVERLLFEQNSREAIVDAQSQQPHNNG
jgi:hypothetical protein